jgi:hypothetical protein
MLPGSHEPTAEAPGDTTDDPINFFADPAGSPLLTAAAGTAVRETPPNSRRVKANADHANGAAPGSPSLPPEPSHTNTPAPRPLTPPEAAATRGTLIPGATADGSTSEPDDDTTDEGAMKPGVTPASSVGDAVAGVGSGDADCDASGRRRGFAVPDVPDVPALRAPVGEFAAGESLFEESEAGSPAVDPAEGARLLDEPWSEALEAPPRARDVPRAGALVDAEAPEDESAPREPVDPAEPVVSAAANGIDAIADPTPSATASAPTRPTYRA